MRTNYKSDYYQKCGVSYTFRRIHPLDWEFSYIRANVGSEITHTEDIFIDAASRNEAELGFYKLLNHWNRSDNWRYWAVI